tara:strand:+ start:6587 stop:7900 length:1314 start_codon:yes stop_codon:yes gene_type:complete
MKIVIVSHFYPPLNKVPSQRVYQTAKAFISEGHEVIVLTTEKLKSDGPLTYEVGGLNNVELFELKYPSFLNGFLKKATNPATHECVKEVKRSSSSSGFLISSLKSLKGKVSSFYDVHELCVNGLDSFFEKHSNYDVIISSYSPSWSHVIASKLKMKNNSAYWLADYRDLWTHNHAKSVGYFFRELGLKKEKNIINKADSLTTVSEGFKRKLEQIHEKSVTVIYNGFDSDELKSSLAIDNLTIDNLFGFNGELITISYVGTLYFPHQSPIALFKLLQKLKLSNKPLYNKLRINFVGRNNDRVVDLAHEYEVSDCIKVFSPVSKSESNYIMYKSDFSLLIDWRTLYEGVIPAKAYEYMNLAKAVLFLGGMQKKKSECYNILTPSGKVCYLDESSSVDDFFAVLNKRQTYTTNEECKNYVDSFERKVLANKMVDIVNDKS